MGRAHKLPRLMVIADGFTRPAARDLILTLAATGKLGWTQLRDHEASPDLFRTATKSVIAGIREMSRETLISINTAVDLAVTCSTGAHVGYRGPSPEDARATLGSDALLGYSIHEPGEITENLSECVDYFLFGPVFDPISKPNATGVGPSTLEQTVSKTARPVLAVGGVTPANAGQCLDAGAYGVATIGGIMQATDPVAALNSYLDATHNA